VRHDSGGGEDGGEDEVGKRGVLGLNGRIRARGREFEWFLGVFGLRVMGVGIG
jgi:hypothetical protein